MFPAIAKMGRCKTTLCLSNIFIKQVSRWQTSWNRWSIVSIIYPEISNSAVNYHTARSQEGTSQGDPIGDPIAMRLYALDMILLMTEDKSPKESEHELYKNNF